MLMVVLGLVMALFMHDQFVPDQPLYAGWVLLGAILLPKLIVGGLYHLLCVWTRRQLAGRWHSLAMRWNQRATSLLRVAVLGLFLGDLWLGGLIALRAWMGNLILLDEAIFLLPSLALICWSWAAYYPIDRRLREVTLINRLDRGLPVHAIWTRRQFVTAQARFQIGQVLAPLLLLLAWRELVAMQVPRLAGWWHVNEAWLSQGLMLAGAGAVFLFSPVLLRYVADTVPMPPGPMRNRLLAICARHRVGLRELLLWRTFGGMINGAVMGLLSPVRYIMLTDALLEGVPPPQIEAVLAHELGHVVRHHLPWLMVAALGTLGLTATLFSLGTQLIWQGVWAGPWVMLMPPAWQATAQDPIWPDVIATAGALPVAAFLFGWISRRLERQADTFAVQHLAGEAAVPGTMPIIDTPSAATMADALGSVASLNAISRNRRSWRHGSIAWRQDYLMQLVGQDPARLSIDRQVRWIKVASAAALLLSLGLEFFLSTG